MVTESYKKMHFNSSLGADTTVVIIIIIIIIIIINIIIWSSSLSSSWIESSSSSDHHHQWRHHHDYGHCYMHYHNVLILKFTVIANVIIVRSSESLCITIIIILAVHCTCLKRTQSSFCDVSNFFVAAIARPQIERYMYCGTSIKGTYM